MSSQNQTATKALQASIQTSKVARAKALPIGEKILAGARLFDKSRNRMLAGIRSEHPDWDADQLQHELKRRLNLQRRIAEKNIYCDYGTVNEDGSIEIFASDKSELLNER